MVDNLRLFEIHSEMEEREEMENIGVCVSCGEEGVVYEESGLCFACDEVHEEVRNVALLEAISEEFGVAYKDIEVYAEEENTFYIDGMEYLIVDTDTARYMAQDEIRELLWAFNSNYLHNVTGIPESVFKSLSTLCESSNEAIYHMIDNTIGYNDFVDDVILEDGLGHFLAYYDGEEREIWVSSTEIYLAYRRD